MLALLLPDLLQHELQVRRLDPLAVVSATVDAPGGNLVQHSFDERRLHLDVVVGELVPPRDRTEDGVACRSAVKMLETDLVREDRRGPRLEGIELSECVFA